MKRQYVTKLKLPDTPGVYIFRDYRKRPLYIGRATSLKDRVKSYFANDLITTRGPRIVDMVTKAVSLSHEKCDSVLEAIILEATLIKRYQPTYNVDERDDKSSLYIVVTDEPWPRVFLERARDFDAGRTSATLDYPVKKFFGPYPNSGLVKEVLKVMRKMFPFKDKKSLDTRHDAFYQAIGKSPRDTDEDAREKYVRTIRNLILFFEGKKNLLRRYVTKEMKQAVDELRFEEAGQAKRLLYALDHINDISLIKASNTVSTPTQSQGYRIEAYDIAHMAGKNVVGAFTVSVNGELNPQEYRKFIISKQTNDDLAGLEEILNRRLNHSEWTYPDLIVVDGNEMHVNRAQAVLKARRISIPVVSVVKNDSHKADRLIGSPDIISTWQKAIIATNAEAHRYVISFHRKRRNKNYLV
jgi:excinuclease ABC subunit C